MGTDAGGGSGGTFILDVTGEFFGYGLVENNGGKGSGNGGGGAGGRNFIKVKNK